jgi:tRNA pseudouridine38-40 synthase
MARYQVILAYDGTQFHGSQRQKDTRTVQGVVEETLRKLNWTASSILLSGRTDAGVHATGQVICFDLDWHHPAQKLSNALNALLPDDVSARHVSEVNPGFHPRYDAVSRSYRYQAFCDPLRHPLRERFAWRVWPTPKRELLQKAADLFLGIHDYAAFGSPMKPGGSTVREVMAVYWYHHDDLLEFEITANAFLYHMVRRLVFVQMKAAQGRLSMDELQHSLQDPQRTPIQGLAPAQGLRLEQVAYQQE